MTRGSQTHPSGFARATKAAAAVAALTALPLTLTQAVEARITIEEDLLGENKVFLMIDATETTPNSIGTLEKATIVVRCQGSKKDLYLSTPTYNGRSNTVFVRWDDGAVEQQYWGRSSDGTAFFTKTPGPFLKKMTEYKRLVLGWNPYNKVKTAVSFDLTSNMSDIKEMITRCSF